MAELEYGTVRGKYQLVDSNVSRAASGTVTFTPIEPDEITDDDTLYTRQKVEAGFDGNGWLGTGNSDQVVLAVGRWEVSFRGVPGLTIKPFQFDVAAGVTVLLPQVQPITPSPAVKFVVNEAVYTETLAARDAAEAARDAAVQAAEDATVPTVEAMDARIAAKRNTASGIAPLDSSSKVPAANLPMAAIASDPALSATIDGRAARETDALMLNGGQPGADVTAAVAAMLGKAKGATRANTYGDPLGTYVLELPAGDFTISEVQGLLGAEGKTSKTYGLKIKGQGSSLTRILYSPATAGALAFNNYWLGLRFEGLTFHATGSGCTFLNSHTTNAAQDYTFTDVTWSGPWYYVFDLQGNDNNSEFRFFGCCNRDTDPDGAFLHIGATNTSDQFLNYWFYGFKHWSTKAPVVRAHKGGHFHFYGLDASNWCADETTSKRYLFELLGNTHAFGVCTFEAKGVRVEAKSTKAALLKSEWPQGTVSFDECDWSSQVGAYTYEDIIDIQFGNVGGPTYIFRGGSLAGGVMIRYGLNAWQSQHRVIFDGVYWRQRLTPSEVVAFDATAAAGNLTPPTVEFRSCRSQYMNMNSTDGGSVWDAVVGYRGERMYALQKRALSVRSTYGAPWASGALKVNLPIGAIITGLRAMSPSGAFTSAATGGSLALATTDAAPATICTATIPGALSAGFDVLGAPATPYLCDTRAKATVTITPTGIDQSRYQGMVLIEGYW